MAAKLVFGAAGWAVALAGCGFLGTRSVHGYAGHYRGDGMDVVLAEGSGVVTGTIRYRGADYPLRAHPDGDGLAGSFRGNGTRYRVKIHPVSDGVLRLESGARTWTVSAAGRAPNPLAAGPGSALASSSTPVPAAVPVPAVVPVQVAAPPPVPSPAGWTGTWHGTINGTPATLRLQARGGELSGDIDASGYPYRIAATGSDSMARGTLVDGRNGAAIPLELQRSGDAVVLTAFGARLDFTRAGAAPAGPPRPAATGGEHDPVLVGTWGRNDTIVSGDASMVTVMRMTVRADGTYLKGNPSASYGGDDWSGTSTGGDPGIRGRWKTSGQIVYTNEGAGWQPYARYYVEGNALMLTFSNGHREVWHRY